MSLDKAMKNLKFDKRLAEWHINNGQLTREEFEAYLKSLPDLAHNVELSSDAPDVEEDSQEH